MPAGREVTGRTMVPMRSMTLSLMSTQNCRRRSSRSSVLQRAGGQTAIRLTMKLLICSRPG